MMNTMYRIAAFAALAVALFALPAAAAEGETPDGWQKELEVGVNLLQSSYSDNWNGGEKGSVVWAARFDGRLEKQLSELTNWRNTLKLVYGQTHSQDRNADGELYWKKPDKSDDLIDFESFFRFTPESWVDPFVAFNFKSMFEDVTDPSRTLTLNPMTFKETAGVARKLIDEDGRFLMTRLGAAFIQNRRSMFINAAPDDETEAEMSTEMAAEIITEYKDTILDDKVVWESRLTLSWPFIWSGKSVFEDDLTGAQLESYGLPTDVADYSSAVDADFENTFTTNITSVISVKFFVRWVYDKYDATVKPVVEGGDLTNAAAVRSAIRKSGQFKQTLALGLTYKFD